MKKYAILLVIGFILLLGCSSEKVAPTIEKTTKSVAKSFKELYQEVDAKHPFEEIDIYQVLDLFDKKQTAIIFFGFPECPKCHQVASALSTAAQNNDIKKINYFNPLTSRNNNTQEYQALVNILKDILPTNEFGDKSLQVPLVVVMEKGVVKTYWAGSLNEAPVDIETLDDAQNIKLINILDSKLKSINIIDCAC